jgi:hypothetical protein
MLSREVDEGKPLGAGVPLVRGAGRAGAQRLEATAAPARLVPDLFIAK